MKPHALNVGFIMRDGSSSLPTDQLCQALVRFVPEADIEGLRSGPSRSPDYTCLKMVV